MSKANRLFKLDLELLRIWRSRFGVELSLSCSVCERRIRLGSMVLRHLNNGSGRNSEKMVRFYHKKCWERLFH